MDSFHYQHNGFCVICDADTTFVANEPYFRNSLKCPQCNSLPRHRALWHCLNSYAPYWPRATVHESSPGWDKVSQRLAAECGGYLASHYNTGYPLGAIVEAPDMPVKKYRNENLEAQTIDDEVVDIVVMQDVFEHVFFPNLAIKEVARTLKPGGLLVMTVPLVNQMRQSRRRAELLNSGETRHLLEPEYHGNPLSPDGSLVTIDWGYDIASYLQAHSDLAVLTIHINNPDMGIEGDLCEVVVAVKRPIANL